MNMKHPSRHVVPHIIKFPNWWVVQISTCLCSSLPPPRWFHQWCSRCHEEKSSGALKTPVKTWGAKHHWSCVNVFAHQQSNAKNLIQTCSDHYILVIDHSDQHQRIRVQNHWSSGFFVLFHELCIILNNGCFSKRCLAASMGVPHVSVWLHLIGKCNAGTISIM